MNWRGIGRSGFNFFFLFPFSFDVLWILIGGFLGFGLFVFWGRGDRKMEKVVLVSEWIIKYYFISRTPVTTKEVRDDVE